MIAPALQALTAHRQFIVYRLEPSKSRPGKLDKLPIDYNSGRVVSAHDSVYWLGYESAARFAQQFGDRHGVGFVITQESKVFCLDIDGCLQPDGQWSQQSRDLCGMFPGAAIERSVSGTGLHVWGRYSGDMPPHGCKNIPLGLELYTERRFIALGQPEGATGNVATDCTLGLQCVAAMYFPPEVAQTVDQVWTTEPCAEWRGPADDDELIRRALASKSATAAFGGRASFADLWHGNFEALARAYPDEARGYDASSADAALAQHLAFWTGKDCERMRRIMLQSKLYRDKWEREDYLPRTILSSVGRQFEVFVDEAARRHEQIAEAMRIGEGSDTEPSADLITLDVALERFILINDGNFIFDKLRPRAPMKADAFVKRYAASKWSPPEESQDDKLQRMLDRRPKPKPIAITKLWEEHGHRKTVHGVTFKAGAKFIVLNTEGQDCVNTWVDHDRSTPPGDPALFLEHVAYLFGEDAPRFLDWLAHIEQRPGELPHQCWLHISKKEGTGRNWLSAVIARLWPGNAAVNFDLAGMFKDGFNGSLSRKIVAVVDEIRDGGGSEKWKNADQLKAAITADTRKINPKFGYQSIEYNSCRWLIFSNHIEALAVNEADRRFNVVYTEKSPRAPEDYRRLYAALKAPSFIAGVANLLRTRDLSGYSPFVAPPMTESKEAVIAAGRSEADEVLVDVVRYWPADVIQSATLGELITGQPGGKITPAHRHALERRGIRWREKPVKIGGNAARVSILRNHERWEGADPYLIAAEVAKVSPQMTSGFGGARGYLDNLTAA